MEILAKLFGNPTKVKLMRLFLFNQDKAYSLSEIMEKIRAYKRESKRELFDLIKIGIVKKRPISREFSIKRGKKIYLKKVNDTGYFLDKKFSYLQALQNLLITVSLHADNNLLKRFQNIGKIKLFIASGVFIQEWETRVDLLIVGDNLNLSKIDRVIKIIESEVGREITYSVFETSDFEYRYGMHDRLIRDILDFPHIILINRLGIGKE